MRGPVYDVEPGSEYLIPFARKRLAQLKSRLTADCPFLRARVFDNGTDTADVEPGRFVDRIRIRGARPWYFFADDISPLVEGTRARGWSFGGLEATSLARKPLGDYSSGDIDRAAVRMIGRSVGLFVPSGGPVKILRPDGRTEDLPDPNEIFGGVSSISIMDVSGGRARAAFVFQAPGGSPSSSSLVFTDGNTIEQMSVVGASILRFGACVVGDQPYYWEVRDTPGVSVSSSASYFDSSGGLISGAPVVFFGFTGVSTSTFTSSLGTTSVQGSLVHTWYGTSQGFSPGGSGQEFYGAAVFENWPFISSLGLSTGTVYYASSGGTIGFEADTVLFEDTPEYEALLPENAGRYFFLYRASDDYPRDSTGGISGPIVPDLVESISLADSEIVPGAPNRYGVAVATNDYDVMTVLTREYPDLSGVLPLSPGTVEVRIGHVLVWASPGTATAENAGATVNADDVIVLTALGDQDLFFVVLGNVAAAFQLNEPSLLSDPFPTAFLRLLKFARGEDGGYSTVETSMTIADVRRIEFGACVSSAGFRAFLQVLQLPGDELPWRSSAGWLGEDMVLAEVYHSDSTSFGSAVSVLPVQVGAVAVFVADNDWAVAFSHSLEGSYVEAAPLGSVAGVPATLPTVDVTDAEADPEYAYVLASVGGSWSLLKSDGTVQPVPTLAAGQSSTLRVDESSRRIYPVYFDLTSVSRYDYVDGAEVQYQVPLPEGGLFSSLVLPVLPEHYRNRLLRQWAAEDEALESGGG